MGTDQDGGLSVMALIKEKTGEHYVFVFDDGHMWDLWKCLMCYAQNPDLSLTIKDAGVLARRAWDMVNGCRWDQKADCCNEFRRD